MWTALLWTWLAGALAGAPRIDGIWDLDRSASQSLDPILVLQGASWVERRVAGRVAITQTIRAVEEGYSITLASSVYERSFTAVPDGEVRPYSAPRMNARSLETTWQGEVLITETVLILADGTIARAREERRLVDETTLEMMVVLEPEGGETIRVRRLFRLVSR